MRPPAGIEWIQADEMTMRCGAGTPVDERRRCARRGRPVRGACRPAARSVVPSSVGHSDIRRLGLRAGPRRAAAGLLRVRSRARSCKAGGPTVKNVSGFDLCRLLVGARGTLGFLGDVILRTRPLPGALAVVHRRGTRSVPDLRRSSTARYRCCGTAHGCGRCSRGIPATSPRRPPVARWRPATGPPALPSGSRRVVVAVVGRLSLTGDFVAEIGVGIVHHAEPATGDVGLEPSVTKLTRRIKAEFDPTGRLNPGVSRRLSCPFVVAPPGTLESVSSLGRTGGEALGLRATAVAAHGDERDLHGR